VCSDKRPIASSLLADGNIDDSEREQLLTEPLTDRLADIQPNFDLSFLAEFGQQTSYQDGDNIFNLALSPLPFFSTILPSTHPEPIQPAAARTSGNLRSPSLSSGDEIPRCIPPTDLDSMISIYDSPTRQSQDSSLFEIGFNATPTSLHASTLVSTAFSSQNPFGQSCQYLAAVVFAVEEFEASCNSGNRAELNSIVAYQKQAIKCCRSMLKCSSCMAKRENLVLLVFVTEKIVAACGRIVVLYRTFGLVFSVPAEHKRGPRTFHIRIWAYPSPHSHQNYYYRYRSRKFWSYSDHMTQRFQFVCRFIKILYPFFFWHYISRLSSQLLYLSSTFWSQRYHLS